MMLEVVFPPPGGEKNPKQNNDKGKFMPQGKIILVNRELLFE